MENSIIKGAVWCSTLCPSSHKVHLIPVRHPLCFMFVVKELFLRETVGDLEVKTAIAT